MKRQTRGAVNYQSPLFREKKRRFEKSDSKNTGGQPNLANQDMSRIMQLKHLGVIPESDSSISCIFIELNGKKSLFKSFGLSHTSFLIIQISRTYLHVDEFPFAF